MDRITQSSPQGPDTCMPAALGLMGRLVRWHTPSDGPQQQAMLQCYHVNLAVADCSSLAHASNRHLVM